MPLAPLRKNAKYLNIFVFEFFTQIDRTELNSTKYHIFTAIFNVFDDRRDARSFGELLCYGFGETPMPLGETRVAYGGEVALASIPEGG